MRGGHELYCLGHMLQAGIAWHRATGERKLLDSGIRMVEYLLSNFGPGKKPIFTGHPELELSLAELYRATRDRRYLDFAGYLLGGDPRNQVAPRDMTYLFSGRPFYTRTRLEGHAVRAMYASSGAADYYLETGDERYFRTLQTLWRDMVDRKMYLTGGVGSRATGEAFGEPYELPNQQAYTESCAAIGNIFWNWRMLQATPEAAYMDVLERALYNGANSGLSLGGNLYCYRNPLELVGNPEDRIRNPWYDTTCCPPNLQRLLGSLPGYFYSTSKDGLYVHLYHNSELRWRLEDGLPLLVAQSTRYPWDGAVELKIEPATPGNSRSSCAFPPGRGRPKSALTAKLYPEFGQARIFRSGGSGSPRIASSCASMSPHALPPPIPGCAKTLARWPSSAGRSSTAWKASISLREPPCSTGRSTRRAGSNPNGVPICLGASWCFATKRWRRQRLRQANRSTARSPPDPRRASPASSR